ncbi:MAG: hypothetical protein IJI67_03200 [Clostridia bacterium]|nr:hypothetical protein [Clostridia bacterium]
MKKTLSLILALCILMSAVSAGFSAFAEQGTMYAITTDSYTDAYCNGNVVTSACAHERITPSIRYNFGDLPAGKYLTGEFEITTATGTIGLADDGSFPMPEQDVSIKAVIAEKTTPMIVLCDTRGITVTAQIAGLLANSEWAVPGGLAENCQLDFNRDNTVDATLTGAEDASGKTIYTLAPAAPISAALEGEYKADFTDWGYFFPYKALVVKLVDGTKVADLQPGKTSYTGFLSKKLTISATVLNKIGKPMANRQAVIYFCGNRYSVKSNAKGVISFSIPLNKKPGKYTAKFSCEGISKVVNITIKPCVAIKILTPKDLAVGTNNAFVRVSFYSNYDNAAEKNRNVKFKISGKTYTVKTDQNGVARLSLKHLKKGSYKLVSYSRYGDTKTDTIKIGVHQTALTAAGRTYKASTKTKKYTATLKDKTNGFVIKNYPVYFKIAGKTYKVKTNSQGRATVKLPKLKKGTYTLKVYCKQSSAYKACSKSVKITIK